MISPKNNFHKLNAGALKRQNRNADMSNPVFWGFSRARGSLKALCWCWGCLAPKGPRAVLPLVPQAGDLWGEGGGAGASLLELGEQAGRGEEAGALVSLKEASASLRGGAVPAHGGAVLLLGSPGC